MGKTVRLADYRPPSWQVCEVKLDFTLSPEATRVCSELLIRANPAIASAGDLSLDGESLKLISASIDGQRIASEQMRLDEKGLTVVREALPEGEFIWRAEVEISPKSNTALEGLYMSGGMYCTQCEPEGFRRISFFPDRPDITARYNVRINSGLPVLLSNGNPVARAPGFAEWQDPWPKPSYLFALVAGDLIAFEDRFRTCEGREVELRIWVRKGDEDRCGFAMDSLKRAMKWDEENYGCVYDLDQFNIVAVDDFNMGAMENKGLNIFNSKLVLARPDTATDDDYENIEGVIAHEYFHNWTGNRVTCRDWFQLSLKEGLTVFRDRQFSSDQRSAVVTRIKDAQNLRNIQFREDAGPLSHPVRPASYREINNFYTATVYEKGAELVSMLHRIVGPETYRAVLDLYFRRHDGEACTIEDWISVFEEVSDRDLSQFARWYSQAGTPRLSCSGNFADGVYRLTIRQGAADESRQSAYRPLLIPVAVGLLDHNGKEVVPTTLLQMTESEQSFEFGGLSDKPVVSILRNFSAPVTVTWDSSDDNRLLLFRHDTDGFNKWSAGQSLARSNLTAMLLSGAEPCGEFIHTLAAVLRDDSLDPAFRALMTEFPAQGDLQRHIAGLGETVDPQDILRAVNLLSDALADELSPWIETICGRDAEYSSDLRAFGEGRLRNRLLRLLTKLDAGNAARRQFSLAVSMSDRLGALRALLAAGSGGDELDEFHRHWSGDRLVLDKWFAIQIIESPPEQAVDLTDRLTRHPDFEWKNPNRFRSVVAALGFGNHAGFHREDGSGYRLLADWIGKMDAANPQVAARLSSAFESWRYYDEARQRLIHMHMQRILKIDGLSGDSSEMLERLLRG
ncbi:MAG: aminopeptidase N [Rhodobacteraceae bacterium]|nr:aminopeptidase N [Paracoccaceae bacterium]